MRKRGKWCAALLAAFVCVQSVLGGTVCLAAQPSQTSGASGFCVITANAQPEEGGTVKGGGVYKQGDTVTLTAQAAQGWKFVYWEKQEQGSQSQYGSLAEKFLEPAREIEDIFLRAGTNASSGTSQTDRVYSTQCVLRASQNVTYSAYFEKEAASSQSGAATSSQTSSSQAAASSKASSQAASSIASSSKASASSAASSQASAPKASSTAASGVGTVGAQRANSVTRNVSLRYVAEAGGTIEGLASQQLPLSGDGQAVVAKPKDGYKFVSWSDGLKTPKRQDVKVEESKTLTALFEDVAPAKAEPAGTNSVQPKTGDSFPGAALFVIALLGVCLSIFFLRRYQQAKAGG